MGGVDVGCKKAVCGSWVQHYVVDALAAFVAMVGDVRLCGMNGRNGQGELWGKVWGAG